MNDRSDATATPRPTGCRQGRTDARPTDLLSGAPDTYLSTGDVCAVLGLTRDQVRHAIRMGRLVAEQAWGYASHRTLTPEDVASYAARAGLTPDWSKLEP